MISKKVPLTVGEGAEKKIIGEIRLDFYDSDKTMIATAWITDEAYASHLFNAAPGDYSLVHTERTRQFNGG